MAYSLVSRADADPPVDASLNKFLSTTTPSPTLPDLPITPLSFAFDEITGNVLVDDPTARPSARDSKVGKLLSSLTGTGTSYDVVEDDDYEELSMNKITSHESATVARSTREEVPARTASVSRQLPLNHPMPDLQSLQGAYVKNVERLEESAERLSMTASLEEEMQRLKMGQRRQERAGSASSKDSQASRTIYPSGQSISNSIVEVNANARSGGYSPGGYITSPVGSIRSPLAAHVPPGDRWSSRSSKFGPVRPDPEADGHPLHPDMSGPSAQTLDIHDPRPVRSPSHASHLERPNSAASGDTFQQANALFTDFDGVHYSTERAGPSRRISLNHPPRAKDARAFKNPQPGTETIYYPAPVPVMLNLPVRLSKANWGDREKRRLQALSEMPEEARKSAPWLMNEDLAARAGRQSMAKLPPQLRASAFFDHKGLEQNVQLKDGSAVATLDSILDAAAHAPVNAFTDHPIAGDLGKSFYGPGADARKSAHKKADGKKKKRKSRAASTMLKTSASADDLEPELGRHSRVPSAHGPKLDLTQHEDGGIDADQAVAPASAEVSEDEEEDGTSTSDEGTDSEADGPGFSSAPTTLLAELQMRKEQQKKRNRTAADAFPNGMHSTLLELDTVAQLQQRARKQKHITLAWEDHEAADRDNFDDDDVPLGMLLSEKEREKHVNIHRPLGLMEKRELEENEPLSMRRARLRGQPFAPPVAPRSQLGEDTQIPTIELPELEDAEGEDEEETLGQRMKRMKDRQENGTSGAFARQLSSDLGLQLEDSPSKTPDPDETLGQRRKRLQQEAINNRATRQVSYQGTGDATRPALKPSRSMADVLQRNPIGFVHPHEAKTAAHAMRNYQQSTRLDPAFIAQQQAAALQSGWVPQTMHPSTMGISPQYSSNMPYMHPSVAYNMSAYSMPMVGQVAMSPSANLYAGTPAGHMVSPSYAGMPAFGYGQDASSLIGMGPPLDAKQRATIDRWRQGIA